jgi:hypothetical protein
MPAYSLRRLSWAGPAATIAAIPVSIIYYTATKALGEQYLLPLDGNGTRLGPMPATTFMVVILIAGLLATVFFGLLIRFARKPGTIFLSVAVTALILSFGGPFSLPASTMQTKILLSGMNIIAAVIITGGILLLSHKKAKVP